MSKYIQMPLSLFLEIRPDLKVGMPKSILNDSQYVVRVRGHELEIGYVNDVWKIH